MRRVFLAVLLATVLLPAAAAAQDCSSAQTTVSQATCLSEVYAAADAELNAVYKTARARLRELDAVQPGHMRGAADALLRAQRAWIPFRDAACETEGFLFRGGSIERLIVLQCHINLTRQRSAQLRTLAEEW